MTTKIELPLPITQIERKPLKRAQIVLELPKVPTPLPLPEIVSKAPQIVPESIQELPEWMVPKPTIGDSFFQNISEALQAAPIYKEPTTVKSAKELFEYELPRVVINVPAGQTPRPGIKSARELFDQSTLGDSVWTPTPVIPVVSETIPMFPELGPSKPPVASGEVHLLTETRLHEDGEVQSVNLIRVFSNQEFPVRDVGVWFSNLIEKQFEILKKTAVDFTPESHGRDHYFRYPPEENGYVIEVVADDGYYSGEVVVEYKLQVMPFGEDVTPLNLV